jgi:hypothetical protein
MRWHAVVLATVLCWSTAQAQLGGAIGTVVMPSPLGIVLSVGKWIYDASTRKQVYYIEVAGQGSNPTEARDNGFRLAVEQALGTLISSETEVQSGRIVRDEIISYAAGFVDRFEIVETRATGTGTLVFMRVWVKRSDLSDRLLNRSEKSGELDGARASVQLQTLNQERATGDALLQQVLNDFPKRAFDIDLKPTDILRQNRSATVEVNFRLKWNQDYLRSICAALQATGQKISRPAVSISVHGGGWFGGVSCGASYDDNLKFELMANRMYVMQPTVLVTIRGSGREVLFSSCYMYQELDNWASGHVTTQRFVEFGGNGARINGNYVMPGRIQIPVGLNVLSRAHSVDMDIVARNSCPNP